MKHILLILLLCSINYSFAGVNLQQLFTREIIITPELRKKLYGDDPVHQFQREFKISPEERKILCGPDPFKYKLPQYSIKNKIVFDKILDIVNEKLKDEFLKTNPNRLRPTIAILEFNNLVYISMSYNIEGIYYPPFFSEASGYLIYKDILYQIRFVNKEKKKSKPTTAMKEFIYYCPTQKYSGLYNDYNIYFEIKNNNVKFIQDP